MTISREGESSGFTGSRLAVVHVSKPSEVRMVAHTSS